MSSEWATFDYRKVEGIPEVAIRQKLLHSRLTSLAADEDRKVLEVGLGGGDVSLMLADRFGDLTCVDTCEETCDRVAARLEAHGHLHPRMIHAPIETAELDEDGYDHIVLLGVLEHLEDPVTVLKRLLGHVRPGGLIHVTVNLAHSIHRLLGEAMGMIERVEDLSDSDIRLGHYRVYTRDELRSHVVEGGFRVTHEDPFYMKPLPTSMLTDLPPEIHDGFDVLARRFPEFASYIYLEAGRPGDHAATVSE